MIEIVKFTTGYAINGDCTSKEVYDAVQSLVETAPAPVMLLTDPPYGNILKEDWDIATDNATFTQWMLDWTTMWSNVLDVGGAFYVWGGVGVFRHRHFFAYAARVEHECGVKIQNVITWGKRRGIGTAYNYLFTREELLFLLKGGKNVKPSVFNVPLLEEERGYAGFNKKYPAKSKYKRRTNVWSDVTEILRGKVHVAEKAARVCEIPIETSSNAGDWIVDIFAGSGTTALAASKLGRQFIVIERDKQIFDAMVLRLQEASV